MACATLKRSLDFDPVHMHGRPPKRQRCIPMSISPSSSPPATRNEGNPSPFSELCPKMTPEMMAACIREEIRRLYRRRQLHFNPNQEVQGDTSSDSSSSPCSNTFGTLYSPSTRDKPLFTFRQTRRSYRRRQLHFNRNQEAQGDTSSDSSSSPFPNTFGTLYSPSTRDKPLFTFRQVGMICERMLTERETQIREEYDRILNMKLSEQYDAFVKFSNDQLHRRFELSAVPSYLS